MTMMSNDAVDIAPAADMAKVHALVTSVILQQAVLYHTIDSGSAVGLLEKNVKDRQCLFCGI